MILQQQDWTPSPTEVSDNDDERSESISPLNLEEEPIQAPTRHLSLTDAFTLIPMAGEPIAETNGTIEGIQESSDEESDDEPDDLEILHMSVDGPQPVITMILHIARVYEDVFPRMSGKRHINPRAFEDMLEQLRRKFWTYR